MRRLLLVCGVAGVIGGSGPADEPPGVKAKSPPPADNPRAFTGSIQVPPDKRDEVLKLLKEKGLTGAYVPETAAPETVMYRGAKDAYEAAYDAVARHLHPEWFAPRGLPRPAPDRKPADNPDDLKRLGVSPFQKELLEAVMKEADKRKADFRPGPGGPTQDQIKKGVEFNGWWRGEWKAVLTREQYTQWAGATTAARDLGPEPKKPDLDRKAEKTDDAILAQLGLSAKQQEHLTALHKKVAAGKADKAATAEQVRKLDGEWRDGLAHTLTDAQMREYRKYWDGT
jgi:hypothetical protein